MVIKKYVAAISLLLVGCMVSFNVGRTLSNKDYEAACKMMDVIRCYKDHIESDSIQDYGCFEEICGDFLEDVDTEEYSWGY